MTFPQYRKLSNNKVFYKINTDDQFEEITISGSKFFHFIIYAQQYPEKLKIQDMLNLSEMNYLTSKESEWNELFNKINQ